MNPVSEQELSALRTVLWMIDTEIKNIKTIDPEASGDRTQGALYVLRKLRRQIKQEFCL